MNFYKGALAALAIGSLTVSACGGVEQGDMGQSEAQGRVGDVGMALTLPDDSEVTSISYTITGPSFSRVGTVPVGNSTIVRFRIPGLPVQNGYSISLSANTSFGEPCLGSANFNVLDNATTAVNVLLICDASDDVGDIIIDGEIQSCPLVTALGAIPAETRVGGTAALSAAISHGDSAVAWTGAGGTFASPTGYTNTFTCTAVGTHTLTATISGLDAVCNASSTLAVTCSASAACGNSIIDAGEQCDDGNTVDGDACTNTCRTASCGDGIAQTGVEECDDGNGVNTDACANACLANVCGNGHTDPNEACDGTPNCSATCTTLGCGDGVVSAALGEQCDDGNTVNTDACTATCQTAVCGDSIILAGTETCDDGNVVAGDGCGATCVIEVQVGDAPQQLAACASCRASSCTDFQGSGYNLVANCFQNADPLFVQECVDVKNCAFENDCGYTAQGTSECFCGTVDLDGCATPGAANGACMPEIQAASRTTTLSGVISGLGDLSIPLGVAFYLQECDFVSCTAACTP